MREGRLTDNFPCFTRLCHGFALVVIGVFPGGFHRRLFGLFLVSKQAQKFCAGHLPQHRLGNRVSLGIVVNINIEAIHDIEMRIGKEFFHRRVPHVGTHAWGHERFEVGIPGQSLSIFEGQDVGGFVWRISICHEA